MTGSDSSDRGRGPASQDGEAADEAARRDRILPPEARRALAEAEARRHKAAPLALPKEISGRGGQEPVRYGDWEVKGIATDF